MYLITFSKSLLLLIFCYFGAAEPPPLHGYGPPGPVEFNSNEVGSQDQYNNVPLDFGEYTSFSQHGSPSGYETSPSFSSPYSSAGSSGGLSSLTASGGKGGVSSSYIRIVHSPGGSVSPSKLRPVLYQASAKNQDSPATYQGSDFGPAEFSDGKFGSNEYSSGDYSSATNFRKSFGPVPAPNYISTPSKFEFHSVNSEYRPGSSDELASYSNGGPSYITFTKSKPFNPSTNHGGSSRSNAYSTSNLDIAGRAIAGQQNIHPSAFTKSLKPSRSKNYNRYSSHPIGSYQAAGSSSFFGNNYGDRSNSFGENPFVGEETGYNSRALKGDHNNADYNNEYRGDDNNFFGQFGDGAGVKVQSSYSTG